MDITKASGEREKFNKRKLYQSLRRAGIRSSSAEKISEEVRKSIRPGMKTERIFDQTFRCLRKENPVWAARYNLKRAIMNLGPTGFPFERYIAAILKEYGYTTKTGRQIWGHCVKHEVDIVAKKGKKHFMIECKYHNRRGIRSDLKVALYTYARFLDLKKVWEKAGGQTTHFYQPWLVTNTRCTSQARRYASCVGLKIISWRYPKEGSLEQLIEQKGLYPVTILPSLNRYSRERLAERRIFLAKDLLRYSPDNLVRLTGLRLKIVKKLKKEVKQLCLS